MASHTENTRRIAKNTLMLYARTLFSMLVSLYTSRVILNALGVEDFGIYNVVGGLTAMFSLITSSLSSSVTRFLTFELGRDDIERLKSIFSTSLVIHVALAGVVFVAAETIGLWFLNTQMTIPAERLYAANWVFQATVLSFMVSLTGVPFNASIVSHERMTAFAYIGITDVVLRLFIVLFIAYSGLSFDRLIVYSILIVVVSVSLQGVYILYCRRNFDECQFRLSLDKRVWKEMSSFAGWNFIGCTAGLLKDQGVNILLNLFMGPVINAARGIAISVNTAVSTFAGNFMTALNPQIIKSYASDDREYMFSLVERGSRFSFYVLLILALPILFETEFILTIWLKQYPEHTISFVRLVLILSMCDILSNTLITLQNATGKIRNYQLVVGGMLMMNFPLSYVCLKAGCPPESTLAVALCVSVCCLMLRLLFLRKMAGLPVLGFLKKVCGNVLMVTVAAAIMPMFFVSLTDKGENWNHFLLVCAICIMCSLASVYFLGCTKNERRFIHQKAVTIKERFLCR